MRMKIMMNKIKNFFRSNRTKNVAYYGLAVWGLSSIWFVALYAATDPLGVFIPAVLMLAGFSLMKTYSAWIAHKRSEKTWMLAVSWVPLSEFYYIYSRKLRSA